MVENSSGSGGPPPNAGAGGPITLDQLIALNDEIAALVRAGVPLERGLVDLGSDIPGRLGDVMQRLGSRLGAGESLPKALVAEGGSLPPIYCALVAAGLKSGRLAIALEGMGHFARGYADLRRVLGLAVLYPLLVFSLAYALFVMFVTQIAPRFVREFEHARTAMFGALTLLSWLGHTVVYWGPAVPAILLLAGIIWLSSGRASALEPGRIDRMVKFVPWARGVLISSRAASFADVLALLIEHGVPLPEAVGLAASATGDPGLMAAGQEIASAIQRGDPLRGTLGPARVVPPVLRWLMVSGQEQAALISALRHAAETYRRRAQNQATMARAVLPTMFLVVIGAVVTLFYGLTLFIPMTALLSNLSGE